MRILLVEDDPRLSADIGRTLETAGNLVEAVSDGEEAWYRGETEDYDAIVLDLGLPKLDGLSVLKRLREAGRKTPVLILTARGSWPERVEGIDAGADDYLPKPFRTEELLARLRAIVRRASGQASSVMRIGGLVLDERQMRVMRNGVPIALTPLEYRLFSHLARNRGRVVSQHELTEHVYSQDWERESNAIEVLVGRIRRKIGNDAIETRRGFGYIVPEEEEEEG
ncbi:response regulator transcription factor [Prosthecomicrobium sp. N25]|uniref:response regulator transcription factor n=1 Tax=Prosthecomicrobium sp. N25 TaxID=3129254 RepID=UPI0030783235